MPTPDFRSAWFASKIQEHSAVTSAETLPSGLVRIERKNLAPIAVAPLGNQKIDNYLVESVLAEVMPTAIVLVPKNGHYDWDARELAMASGSTILTVREAFSFMGEGDPRPLLDRRVDYNRDLLEQHTQVVQCQMICESSMRLRRRGPLGDVVVAIEYEYEFSEEGVVQAINRHPDADVLLNANPNGEATSAARSHARHAGTAIYKASELMGALNYDGDQLITYEAPNRRREVYRRNGWR
jgi:hypothetical protein